MEISTNWQRYLKVYYATGLIKAGDGPSLLKLADSMEHWNTAMASIQYLSSLSSAEENIKILKKLPRYIADRWNRIVDRWLYDTADSRYPPFSEFCKFISDEARVVCGPGNLAFSYSDTKTSSAVSQQKAAETVLAINIFI